ncbi:MAG: hypothetical protein WD851_24485 [Pirellulales bacterium]
MELPSREKIATQVRTLQIIVAALVMGCLTFAIVAVVIRSNSDTAADNEAFPVMTAMALAFGTVAIIAQLVIAPLLRRQTRQRLAQQSEASDADGSLILMGLQTSTIVGAAISEGACFFNLVAYLLEGSPYTLVMAAVLVLTIVLRFPTVGGVTDWLEREIRLVEEREMRLR